MRLGRPLAIKLTTASALRLSSKWRVNNSSPPSHPRISGARPFANDASDSGMKKPSKHLIFYREIIPAMIPIFILGSAVYMVSSIRASCGGLITTVLSSPCS